MRHDELCEWSERSSIIGPACKCATRAYARDPLPDDLVPIYAEPKPRLEGTL